MESVLLRFLPSADLPLCKSRPSEYFIFIGHAVIFFAELKTLLVNRLIVRLEVGHVRKGQLVREGISMCFR